MVDINWMTVLTTVGNWIFIAVCVFIAYRAYCYTEKQIIRDVMAEEMDKTMNKLTDKIMTLNAIRGLRQI
jgi:large-conductance mechanosensitive channel